MTTRHAPKPDADGLNRKLLRKVQAYIHAEESAWNQGSWAYHNGDHFPTEKDSCGTAYCFAGTAAVLAGQRLAWGKVFPDEPSSSSWEAANVLAPGATVPQWKAATKKLLAAALKLNDRPDDKEVDRQYWEATDALMNMRGESIKEVAVRLLGITDYDADVLFASGNSLEELDAMVETLCASGPGSLVVKIHFRNALLDQNWDYELSPCSVVPRLYEHIILPVGEQRPDGKFDLREYKVDIVQWWPSEGFVRVFVTPTRGHVSAPV